MAAGLAMGAGGSEAFRSPQRLKAQVNPALQQCRALLFSSHPRHDELDCRVVMNQGMRPGEAIHVQPVRLQATRLAHVAKDLHETDET